MKALIKATGEIKDVCSCKYANGRLAFTRFIDACENLYTRAEIEIIPDNNFIDWEQRQWDATVAAMQGLLFSNPEQMQGNNGTPALPLLVIEAIEYANALIEEYKKQQ